MTRGALARKRARYMRAIYLIMAHYKRYKMRTYIKSIVKLFHNVRQMRDYGKHVQWPKPPAKLQGLTNLLQQVHSR